MQTARTMVERLSMHSHIIVSGDDALATTIVEELNNAGARVVKLTDDTGLADAGVARALAVICAGNDDARNLEIALLARKANPNVRVVARLANEVLRGGGRRQRPRRDPRCRRTGGAVGRRGMSGAHRAPLRSGRHQIPRLGRGGTLDATLREIYADLAPVAVIHGKNSPHPACWRHVRAAICRCTPVTGRR